ncbi:serine/threonine-protein phosphatase 6 regulatory ankyrin repeat subunit B-like [Asparagus officinalis]|uniref:serine/threonine-protein phosphatase 6 regulatory ankyrin repeat subunit B-like n=1 Tax=Asparagus officinalis TaxID=4686 RepID=UPI00098E635B|nr:serine/threonine-protein phosphatase 6 regulatory ankyrin repeat subunit B-like [Asparagus officinalis]
MNTAKGTSRSEERLFDVDSSAGSDGQIGLILAVSSGSLDAVRVLVGAGARIDLDRDRVFHEAAGGNRIDLISALENSNGVVLGWARLVDSGGRTPVHYAAANGHLDAVKICLESGDGDPDQADWAGWSPLHCAAYGGFLDVVEFLIERSNFDPKIAVTFDGKKTPLDLAVEAGHSHLHDVLGLGDKLLRRVRVGDVDGVSECIFRGVGVNRKDQNGWAALHWAAFGGWVDIVRLLVENAAQLDVADDVGFTPLRCAVEGGRVEVALLLASYGAHTRLKGVKGADLFSMKLDSCAANAGGLLSFGGDSNQIVES